MKKKLKSKWILLLAGLASAFFLGGCTLGESLDEIKEGRDLTARVTYYSNGGKFDGGGATKDIYYKDGAKILNIKTTDVAINGTAKIERSNYNFEGWYYAVDEDGEVGPDKNEDTQAYITKDENVVDFSVPIKEGEHLLLVAKWTPKVKVDVQLVFDGAAGDKIPVAVAEGAEEISYANGEIIKTYEYDARGNVEDPRLLPPINVKDKAYTFLEYYTSADCTEVVTWPQKIGEDQEKNAKIYAKYVKGDWQVVKQASDVQKMFGSGTANKNFWLLNDVDASSLRAVSPKTTFNGKIEGNGYTISGLKVSKRYISISSKVALFGELGEKASIKNLTMDKLNIEYEVNGLYTELYFAFTNLHESATVENVKLLGTMTVSRFPEMLVMNMEEMVEEELKRSFTACLYGGYETDAAYLAAKPNGFTVNEGADPSTYITIKDRTL